MYVHVHIPFKAMSSPGEEEEDKCTKSAGHNSSNASMSMSAEEWVRRRIHTHSQRTKFQQRFDVDVCRRKKFSKVSALVGVLYKVS